MLGRADRDAGHPRSRRPGPARASAGGARRSSRRRRRRHDLLRLDRIELLARGDRRAASGPLWLQLYLWRSPAVVEGLVERARAAGYHALVLTVDVPVVGNRERDVRNGASLPPRIRLETALDALRRPAGSSTSSAGRRSPSPTSRRSPARAIPARSAPYVDRELKDPSATWERLDWLRRLWDGPLVVKGILSARDAAEAVRVGRMPSTYRTTAAASSTARLPRSTCCPASSRRSATAPRSCSTAASDGRGRRQGSRARRARLPRRPPLVHGARRRRASRGLLGCSR